MRPSVNVRFVWSFVLVTGFFVELKNFSLLIFKGKNNIIQNVLLIITIMNLKIKIKKINNEKKSI
jgi:hypothetical protein